MTPRAQLIRFLLVLLPFAAAVAAAVSATFTARPEAELRVCADPNNLPFSNDRGEGFENALAELVARHLNATVRYTWHAQRRGFIRNTLAAGRCDVVMGVPRGYDPVRTTAPYYRSTYVFLYRAGSGVRVRSLEDDGLRRLQIGVHVIGDDYANAPPAHALAARGLIANVRGYSIYGNYAEPHPPARLVEAVAAGEVDVAIAWGPLAGYFASRQPVPLEMVPVPADPELPALPFTFDISMGVRRDDEERQRVLDEFIERNRDEIARLLRRFGVPVG